MPDSQAAISQIVSVLREHADHVCGIAVSMGKDSVSLLDLTFRAYLSSPGLPKLHILYADTGLEAPSMAAYINGQIEKIEKFIADHDLPITFHKTLPPPTRSMWGRVIGHGYMMPLAKVAHWCTESLKLTPMKKKMEGLLGSDPDRKALTLVGVREKESGTRKVSIDASLLDEDRHLLVSRQRKNEVLFAPLRLWSEEDVWSYIDTELTFTDPAAIRAVYNLTESSGSLRSGCLFCPVVRKDKNLEQEVSLNPDLRFLLRWRNYLANLADPKHKTKLRHFRRQRGDVAFYFKKGRRKGEQGEWEFQRGYYPQRIREHFLKVVLHAQFMTQRRMPGFSWISRAELDEIRRIWVERHGEVEDSLPIIYYRIFGNFWECGMEWEIASGTHRWFAFARKEKIKAAWEMTAQAAPEIDAERVLRTAHALNNALDNIDAKERLGAWCDDHIEQARELLAALMKTDWRSEREARRALERMLERGEEPPKSMPRLDLHTVRDLLRNARVSIEAEQDREWARLLDLYDQIPEEKRTDEMKALIAEGMTWGDPRRPQIELPLVGVRHRVMPQSRKRVRQVGMRQACA